MSVTATPPVEETWNLEAIFPSPEAFQQARNRLEKRIPDLGRWRGLLDRGPATVADALEAVDDASRELARLRCYASLRSDTDIRLAANQALRQQVELIATDLQRQTAYLRPELLDLDDEILESFLESEPRLAPFAFFVRDLVRQRDHVLEPAAERVLAEASLMSQSPGNLFQVLNNVDLPRPQIVLSDGEKVRLSPVEFYRRRKTPDREDRRLLFESFYGAYEDFADTLAHNLLAGIKSHLFQARARGHRSCLAAALNADRIPERVYSRLIEQVREHLPLLHRFFSLRAKHLDLETLEYHDLHGPLSETPPRIYDPATARQAVIEAMRPLGDEYTAQLEQAFASRWVDWHPGEGKRSGAYATGWAYDVHPYVLLNFTGEFESVSTLAHEMGHAMHSYFSNRHQPHANSNYSIFVAEVASTLNEALLSHHLLQNAEDDEERLFLLGRRLDGLRGTLFRQCQFAEFELALHEATENGAPLTAESVCERYLDQVRIYHGSGAGVVRVDERYRVEWAAVPHFFYDFYVYQYATGIVAATALAERVLQEGNGAVEGYLDFLRSGGSAYPLDQLRQAGVDLESRAPYQAVFSSMERHLDEFERLLSARRRA